MAQKSSNRTDAQRRKSAEYARRWRAKYPEKVKAQNQKWHVENSPKRRDMTLKRKYGISFDDFNAILKLQGNRCLICKTSEWGPHGPHLDHCHETGKIRGILCKLCNTGLGMFQDNPENVIAAYQYLIKN